jgi:hypothetical protein
MSKFESGDPEVKKPAPETWFGGEAFDEVERQRALRRAEESTPEALEASYLVAEIEKKMLERQPRRYYAVPLTVNNLEDYALGGTEYIVEFARTGLFGKGPADAPWEQWGIYYSRRVRHLDEKPAYGRLRQALPCVKLAFLRIAPNFIDGWHKLYKSDAPMALSCGRAAMTLLADLQADGEKT